MSALCCGSAAKGVECPTFDVTAGMLPNPRRIEIRRSSVAKEENLQSVPK